LEYTRIRLVLCRAWAMPPWELDRAIAENRVALGDAMVAVLAEAIHNPQIDQRAFLDPAGEAVREAHRQELKARKQQVLALSLKLSALGKKNPNLDDPESMAIKATLQRLSGKQPAR
jgi:hypothetical protein